MTFIKRELDELMERRKGGVESTTAELKKMLDQIEYNLFMESICAESKKQLECLKALWQDQAAYEVLPEPARDDEQWVTCLTS